MFALREGKEDFVRTEVVRVERTPAGTADAEPELEDSGVAAGQARRFDPMTDRQIAPVPGTP